MSPESSEPERSGSASGRRVDGAQRTLLVYRTGQLGDTLVSLPAVRAIKAAYPEHGLVLLTDRHPGTGLVSSWEVFEATGLFVRVIFYTPATSARGWLLQLVQIVRQVRPLRPEAVFYLRDPHWTHGRRDRWFFHILCGIGRVYGPEETGYAFGQRDSAGKLWRLPSETDRLLGILAANGLAIPRRDAVPTALPIDSAQRARVDRLLREAGVSGDAPLLALGPGSKMPAKQWPIERFEELSRRLLAAYPSLYLLIVGGSEDEALARRLVSATSGRAISAVGRLSVLESADMLSRCRLYVGNDTGAMHLAAAMGTRCVGIFCARDHPGRWDPYGPGHVVLRTDPICSGCLLQACVEHNKACLTAIHIDQVFGAIQQILAAPAKENRALTASQACA